MKKALAFVLALTLPLPAWAQPAATKSAALPATPVGVAVRQFVDALNSLSQAALEKFHTDRGGSAENADADLEFAQQSGGIDLGPVLKSSDFQIEIEAKTRKDGRAVILLFAVEPSAPHAVSDIGVRPVGGRGPGPGSPNGPVDPPRVSPDRIVETAPGIVDQAIANGFSGVVLVARDGKPVLERTAGLAHRGFGVANRIDTKFNLGSINKTFTRLAIAQLMQAGKLSLDDTLGRHLPDFPNQEAAAKVTIAHLVDMKSGLGDFFGAEFDAVSKSRVRTLSDYLPFFVKKPLAFEPGTSRAYSNGGYVTLGLIIEKVTGMVYHDYVRENIFKPAGMNDTDAYPLDATTPNLAVGYTKSGVSNIYSLPARGSSAGGGYSTAPDLLRYAEAVMANRLASPAHTAWYLGGERPEAGAQKASDNASRQTRGGLGIAGGSPGVNGALEVNAADRVVIVVLANQDPPMAENLARKIRTGNQEPGR
jgi:CubicO group peptidase (beta-lactamase class C family)